MQLYANDSNKIIQTLLVNLRFHFFQDNLVGYLWIATVSSGLYKYDIIKNKLIVHDHNKKDFLNQPAQWELK